MLTRRLAALAAAGALCAPALGVDRELAKQARDPDAQERSEAARALGREGSREAAAILVELLSDRSPEVRDAAVLACAGIRGERAVDALSSAARDRDELARRNAAEALGRTASDAALPPLRRLALLDPAEQVRSRALDALVELPPSEERLEIVRKGAADGDPEVRAAAVETAGALGAAALDVVCAALADPDDGVRCVGRAALVRADPAAASERLGEAAADPSWRVRAQAVDDAAALGTAGAVDVLVELLADPRVRVSAAAHRALRGLTGRSIDRDRDLWAAWWRERRSGWQVRPGADALAGAVPEGSTRARYHGLDVASEGAVFVIDLSGSMEEPVSADDARTRHDAAADELAATLGTLPDGFPLEVVVFREDVRAAFGELRALSRRTRGEAERFLRRAGTGSGGDLLGALERALRVEDADTVYLLSDGAPTAGDMVHRRRVEERVRRLNRRRKCVIHAIGLGSEKTSDRSFLDALARDSGGSSVHR